eukprot:SAG22_NODE_6081_length_902_cov_1.491905_1_plen_217_part_10
MTDGCRRATVELQPRVQFMAEAATDSDSESGGESEGSTAAHIACLVRLDVRGAKGSTIATSTQGPEDAAHAHVTCDGPTPANNLRMLRKSLLAAVRLRQGDEETILACEHSIADVALEVDLIGLRQLPDIGAIPWSVRPSSAWQLDSRPHQYGDNDLRGMRGSIGPYFWEEKYDDTELSELNLMDPSLSDLCNTSRPFCGSVQQLEKFAVAEALSGL